MSKAKPQSPPVDFGFHIVIPRVVRTGYKDVSLIQKWLYACLKDLCGDHGTCYRSLRVLAEETGFSTGMLSESIQVLHTNGLIHAEKKKRTGGGKEVWHITIIDIWQENVKAHPTKRSQYEQTQETPKENVHTVNKKPVVCSQYEQECSQCETEVITLSNNSNEAITNRVSSSELNTETITENENIVQPALGVLSGDAPPANGKQTPAQEKPPISTMRDRIEAVYNCYEQLCREKFDDGNITIKRRGNRTEEYKAIKDALESKDGITPTSLRQVFLDMWNERGREGEYFYRDLTHITIRAVCNQHATRLANIRFREKKPSNKSVSGLPNLTFAGAAKPVLSSFLFGDDPYLSSTVDNADPRKPGRKLKLRRVADIEAEIAARNA